MRLPVLISAVLCLSASIAAVPTRAANVDCDVPAALIAADFPLDRVAQALRRGRETGEPLRIVALGSSTTAGAGASTAKATYPSLLEADLRERFEQDVTVANKGIGGELASQMVARLETDVIAERPALVVWQTGTNDYLQDVPEAEFAAQIETGLRRIHAADADVILMEPQWLRRLARSADYQRLLELLRRTAAKEKVGVFRRFDVMQNWIDAGRFDEQTMMSPDGLHMIDASYLCLANLVARQIDHGVAQARAARSPAPVSSLSAPVGTAR